MSRLTPRGWNNVIIFSMLAMVFMFNSTSLLKTSNSDLQASKVHLLPSDVPLMKLDFGHHQIERIGQGWRLKPFIELKTQTVDGLIANWQQTLASPTTKVPTSTSYVIVAWLAGEEQGRVFKLEALGKDLLVEYNKQSYLLTNQPLSHLLPEELH